MLDHSDYIARYDKHDILGVIAGQPKQLLENFELNNAKNLTGITNIVVAGMGGSALAAEFIKHWLADRLNLPLEIVRGYDLPAYVSEQTLLIASSYSGNTEETLNCLDQAKQRGAQIVVSAAGGKLIESAKADGLPYFVLPGGLQPRFAVLYGVKALATLFEHASLAHGLTSELETAAKWVNEHTGGWDAATPVTDNTAKQIAEALLGHPVVVYGGPTLALAAMKWKIDANENAKNLAFYNALPEFNHNEFLGWGHPEMSGLKVVELQSSLDHPQVMKRFEVSNRLLSGQMPAPIIVTATGESKLEQLLWTLILGDYAMSYLAFLNQVDPTPVPMIEKLKTELA